MSSDNTLIIRSATLDDFLIIVKHRRAMFEAMGTYDPSGFDIMDANFAQWVQDHIVQNKYVGWFCTDTDEVVAGAGLWLIDWPPHPLDSSGVRGHILNVYTDPAYRRRGIARRLMNTMLEWCRERNIKTIGLHASDEGRALYESLGFTATNEMRLNLP